jgi:hypothetical protein
MIKAEAEQITQDINVTSASISVDWVAVQVKDRVCAEAT